MRCKNYYCSWNCGEECGYPYEISLDEDGNCETGDTSKVG